MSWAEFFEIDEMEKVRDLAPPISYVNPAQKERTRIKDLKVYYTNVKRKCVNRGPWEAEQRASKTIYNIIKKQNAMQKGA